MGIGTWDTNVVIILYIHQRNNDWSVTELSHLGVVCSISRLAKSSITTQAYFPLTVVEIFEDCRLIYNPGMFVFIKKSLKNSIDSN